MNPCTHDKRFIVSGICFACVTAVQLAPKPTLVEQVEARLCAEPDCDRLGQRFCEVEGCAHKFCFPHVERCPNCRSYICGSHWDAHMENCELPWQVQTEPTDAEKFGGR